MRTRWPAALTVAFSAVCGLAAIAFAGQPAATRRPLPGTDAAKVLFEMQDGLGLLRGLEQSDSVARVEYWGSVGSMTVDGKTSKLTSYKVSVNYDVGGMRFDFTHDGKRHIQVVTDKYAWDEETPGGVATPSPAAAAERRLQVWLTPIGVAKAAAMTVDTMKVTIDHGTTRVSFPFEGATIAATLNSVFLPVTVEAQSGQTMYSRVYAEYGELNDNARADVYLPRRIVHKVGGVTVLDLTVTHSNTYNPYVVMPIPPNVR